MQTGVEPPFLLNLPLKSRDLSHFRDPQKAIHQGNWSSPFNQPSIKSKLTLSLPLSATSYLPSTLSHCSRLIIGCIDFNLPLKIVKGRKPGSLTGSCRRNDPLPSRSFYWGTSRSSPPPLQAHAYLWSLWPAHWRLLTCPPPPPLTGCHAGVLVHYGQTVGGPDKETTSFSKRDRAPATIERGLPVLGGLTAH